MFRRLSKYCCVCVKDSNSSPLLDRKETGYNERDKYLENAIKAVINKNYEEAEAYLGNAQSCDPPFDISDILEVIKEVQPTTEVEELMKAVENDIADEKYEEALTNLVELRTLDHKINVSHLYHAVTVGFREYNDKLAAEQAKEIERMEVDDKFDFDIAAAGLNKDLIDAKKSKLLEKSTQTSFDVNQSESSKLSRKEILVNVSNNDDLNETKEEKSTKPSIYNDNEEIHGKNIAVKIEDNQNNSLMENHLITQARNENNEELQKGNTSKHIAKDQNKEIQAEDTEIHVMHFKDEKDEKKDLLHEIENNENKETKAESITNQLIQNENEELRREDTTELIEDDQNEDLKSEISTKEVVVKIREDMREKVVNNKKGKAEYTPKQNEETQNKEIHGVTAYNTNEVNLPKDAMELCPESGNSSGCAQVLRSTTHKRKVQNSNEAQASKSVDLDQNTVLNNALKTSQKKQNTTQVNEYTASEEDTPIIEAPLKKSKNYVEIEKYIEEAVTRIESHDNFPFRPSELLGKADRLSMKVKNSVADSTLALLLKIKPINKMKRNEILYKKACKEFQKGNYGDAQVFALISLTLPNLERTWNLIREFNDERFKTVKIEADKRGSLGPFKTEYNIESYKKLAAILYRFEDAGVVADYFSSLATKTLKEY